MNSMSPTAWIALEQRAVQLGIYTDIIPSVLSVGGDLSVTKLLILSFIIKQRLYSRNNAFDGKVRMGYLRKATCDVAGHFDQLLVEIRYFCESVYLLVESDVVRISSDDEVCLCGTKPTCVLRLGNFECHLIEECCSLNDSFVLTEVLRNV